jgi:hypothetical protein
LNTDEEGKRHEGTRTPNTFWSALTDLLRSYAEYNRALIKGTENPHRPKDGCAAWVTAAGTTFGAVAAAVAAWIFLCQLAETQKQLSAEELHFRLEQRPILALDNKEVPSNVFQNIAYNDAAHQLFWNFGVTNFGKSTAFRVHSFQYVSVLGGAFRGRGTGHGGLHIPDVVPGAGYWGSATYDLPVTLDTAKGAKAADGGVVMKVILRYEDAVGDTFESFFCMRYLISGAIENCTAEEVKSLPTISPPPPFEAVIKRT